MNNLQQQIDEFKKNIDIMTETLGEITEQQVKLIEDLIHTFRWKDEPPRPSAIGTECQSKVNPTTGKVEGSTLYWARPRLDTHSRELYDSIYSWCEESFNPARWMGDKNNQIYYFNEIKDRDWFMIRWG